MEDLDDSLSMPLGLLEDERAETPLRESVACEAGPVPGEEADITSAQKIDSQRLSQWVTCICVFVFDLERGQSLETVYPPSVVLPPATVTALKFLAFPDSNTGFF
jgi:hypothetical protein